MTVKELQQFIRMAHIKPDMLVVIEDTEFGIDKEAMCVEYVPDCIIAGRAVKALRITK